MSSGFLFFFIGPSTISLSFSLKLALPLMLLLKALFVVVKHQRDLWAQVPGQGNPFYIYIIVDSKINGVIYEMYEFARLLEL